MQHHQHTLLLLPQGVLDPLLLLPQVLQASREAAFDCELERVLTLNPTAVNWHFQQTGTLGQRTVRVTVLCGVVLIHVVLVCVLLLLCTLVFVLL